MKEEIRTIRKKFVKTSSIKLAGNSTFCPFGHILA